MFRKQYSKTKNITVDHEADRALITAIAMVINKNPVFVKIQKGIWAWNLTDHYFFCSAGFCDMMNILPFTAPDFNFWIDRLTSADLIKFTEALENVVNNKKSQTFFFKIYNAKLGQRIIQCFMERMKSPENKNYVIGVCCDISELIFPVNKN